MKSTKQSHDLERLGEMNKVLNTYYLEEVNDWVFRESVMYKHLKHNQKQHWLIGWKNRLSYKFSLLRRRLGEIIAGERFDDYE